MSEVTLESLQEQINNTRTRVGELSDAGASSVATVKNIAELANTATSNTEELKKEVEQVKQAVKTSFTQLVMGISMLSEKSAQSMTMINALLMYMGGYTVEGAKDYLRKFFTEQEKKIEEAKKLAELRKSSGVANKQEEDPLQAYMEVRSNRLKMVDPNFDAPRFWDLLDLLTVADSIGQEPTLSKLESGFNQFDLVQEEYKKYSAPKTGDYIPADNVVQLKPKD